MVYSIIYIYMYHKFPPLKIYWVSSPKGMKHPHQTKPCYVGYTLEDPRHPHRCIWAWPKTLAGCVPHKFIEIVKLNCVVPSQAIDGVLLLLSLQEHLKHRAKDTVWDETHVQAIVFEVAVFPVTGSNHFQWEIFIPHR